MIRKAMEVGGDRGKVPTMDDVATRSTCRSCGGDLSDVVDMGEQWVVDFVDAPGHTTRPKAPLILCRCRRCTLVQLRHTVHPSFLYDTFWYRSGINELMRAALADVTRAATERVGLTAGDAVLDIGCNDGTLLASYGVQGLVRVGFDQSLAILAEAEGRAEVLVPAYFEASKALAVRDAYRAITAIAMFYDLEHPHDFLAQVARCLAPDGVFIIQMNYLPAMLEENAFDNVCHEHLCYYSLSTLSPILSTHGLVATDVEENTVNGGSFRIYIQHEAARRPASPQVAAMLAREQRVNPEAPDALEAFAARVGRIRELLRNEIERAARPIFLYGASTRGSTLVQTLAPPPDTFAGAAERDPRKYGRHTVGTWIPIVPEEEARGRARTFLVLPWHFWSGIRERERTWIDNGGTFVLPLPWPRRVRRDGEVVLE